MTARPLSKSSNVVGTGLGGQSHGEWDSPRDMACSAHIPTQSVSHGGSLSRRSLPLSGIPLYPLSGWTVVC